MMRVVAATARGSPALASPLQGLAVALIAALATPGFAQEKVPQPFEATRFDGANPVRPGPPSGRPPGDPDWLMSGESGVSRDSLLVPEESISVVPLRDGHDLIARDDLGEGWSFQLLPDGLIYRSYLAGVKEPRFASAWVHDRDLGWIWDIALGGRVGVLRYGTANRFWPEGWQIDLEGAAFPRLDLEHERDLLSADFRFGVPVTYGTGRFQAKLAYYHVSSHLGDEYMVRHETLARINYSRDVLVWGNSFHLTPSVRLYAEAAWAFYCDGGSEPWEFQFGIDYSPIWPSDVRGTPFLALNTHLRQEVDFGGNFVLQTGWQWRGYSGHLFRLGMQYYTGNSDQYEMFRRYEEKVGLGLWYDY